MDREEIRIKKMLEEGKLSSLEAEKLLSSLTEQPRKEKRIGGGGDRKKAITLFVGLLAVLSLILLAVFLKRENIGGNLLLNPSFEKGFNNQAASWTASAAGLTFFGGTEKKDFFMRDSKNTYQGQYSISIRNKGGKQLGLLSWYQRMTTFPKEKKLRLSGYIKTEDVADDGVAALVLRGLLGLKEEALSATTAMSYNLSGTSDWTKVQVEIRIDKKIEELQVLCQLTGLGTIWCDDLSLREVD